MSQKGASARQQIGQQPLKVNHDAAMQRPGTSGQAQASINQTTQVWVTKWVDYSSKYGLGYLLSDMSAGVFFNDSTKIVAESSGSQFYYYERKAVAAMLKPIYRAENADVARERLEEFDSGVWARSIPPSRKAGGATGNR